jgi:hypothetical protein
MFNIKLCHLTYMFLDARLDVLLRFTNVEAITIISITQNFVYASSSAAREVLAAVGALFIDFILLWTVARARIEVCIDNSPTNFSPEIPS